jgi:hypothetical protein
MIKTSDELCNVYGKYYSVVANDTEIYVVARLGHAKIHEMDYTSLDAALARVRTTITEQAREKYNHALHDFPMLMGFFDVWLGISPMAKKVKELKKTLQEITNGSFFERTQIKVVELPEKILLPEPLELNSSVYGLRMVNNKYVIDELKISNAEIFHIGRPNEHDYSFEYKFMGDRVNERVLHKQIEHDGILTITSSNYIRLALDKRLLISEAITSSKIVYDSAKELK